MSADRDLELLAGEELAHAVALDWRKLAPLVPWGDTFSGFSPAGLTVQLSRSYLWADQPGGDILVEVAAYLDEARYDQGARKTAVIRRPSR